MAFAPYYNDNRGDRAAVQGAFRLPETNKNFEFIERNACDLPTFAPDFPHRVFVGAAGTDTRCARVLKTVAYVVVDEAADGSPVVEKWAIANFRKYDLGRAGL